MFAPADMPPRTKSEGALRTISEVAEELDVPQHVLRFWEDKFDQISPVKRAGGRRYYRPDDVEAIRTIKRLLYDEGYTIKGVVKLYKEKKALPKPAESLGTTLNTLMPETVVATPVPPMVAAPLAPPPAMSDATRKALLGILDQLMAMRGLV
jgi:DNA-binding transcriptional MerR regulator